MDLNAKQMRIEIGPIYNVAFVLSCVRNENTKNIFEIIYGNPFQLSTEEGRKEKFPWLHASCFPIKGSRNMFISRIRSQDHLRKRG